MKFCLMSPSHKNDPQTYPFFDRQSAWNNLTFQRLHHWTSPWQCWLYCFLSLLTDPDCRNPNCPCAKPQGLLRQQKKCLEQPCRSPVILAAVTWPETLQFSLLSLCVTLCAIFHWDKKLVETWYSKSPSALKARGSTLIHCNYKLMFVMMTQRVCQILKWLFKYNKM